MLSTSFNNSVTRGSVTIEALLTAFAMTAVGPQPAPARDIVKELENVPLFMRSLPEDAEEDVAINALQSLIHEGTPDEIAENFKETGNEYAKGKRWTEARGFYTQGIDAKPSNSKLMEALLCNRAACNLELQNYGSVLRDCSRAITLNSQSSKAHYRSAVALLSLRRYEECIDCCTRCLDFDPVNTSVKSVLERASSAKKLKEEKEKEQQKQKEEEASLRLTLRKAYKLRNITIVENDEVETSPSRPHFLDEDRTTLAFPVFFLYPQHATSDLISEYDETVPFTSHLMEMFPSTREETEKRPTWDQQGEYLAQNLVVYATTRQNRILKVGKKMNLTDVFKASEGGHGDGLELKNGCLTFVVLPKGDVEQRWIQRFKETR